MTQPIPNSILEKAVSTCQDLAKAAEVIGSANPIDAIRQIECDPEKIRTYADSLRDALKDLDESIREAEAALNKQENSKGEGSKSAIEEAKQEVDELNQEYDELEKLIEKIRRLADELEEQLGVAASKIVTTAEAAKPAVDDVLISGGAGVSPEAESTVNKSVQEIVRIAEQVQATADKLCDEFEEFKDSAEDVTDRKEEKGEIERGGGGTD